MAENVCSSIPGGRMAATLQRHGDGRDLVDIDDPRTLLTGDPWAAEAELAAHLRAATAAMSQVETADSSAVPGSCAVRTGTAVYLAPGAIRDPDGAEDDDQSAGQEKSRSVGQCHPSGLPGSHPQLGQVAHFQPALQIPLATKDTEPRPQQTLPCGRPPVNRHEVVGPPRVCGTSVVRVVIGAILRVKGFGQCVVYGAVSLFVLDPIPLTD